MHFQALFSVPSSGVPTMIASGLSLETPSGPNVKIQCEKFLTEETHSVQKAIISLSKVLTLSHPKNL